jgi:Flp pilus assembly pilin Flp
MKSIVKKLVRDEKGAALIMALILLLIGGLISAALLNYMGSGILAGEVHERRTAELYAADAGVEDAMWKIQNPDETDYLPCSPGSDPKIYTITDINGREVQVTIEFVDWGTYRIASVAAIDDGGGTAAIDSSTAVESYVTIIGGNYSAITDHILTSQDELEWAKKVNLIYTEEENGPADHYIGLWPTPAELAQFYWQNVMDETHYYVDTEIDLDGNSCPPGPVYVNGEENNNWPLGLGPLFIDGELDILNSSNDEVTLTLDGTLYVTGDTLIGQNGKDFILDLNGHTIFVSSSTADNKKALVVGGQCTVKGPGALIAVGDVYFAPKGDVGSNEEPVFIFSVIGATQLQPSGDFYGAIAGSVFVDVQPGYTPTIIYPPGGFEDDDLNFPGFTGTQPVYTIASWDIIQQ